MGRKERPFLINFVLHRTAHSTHLPQPPSAPVHQLPIPLGQPLVIDGQQQLQTDQEEVGASLALCTLSAVQGAGTHYLIQDQNLGILCDILHGTLQLAAKVLGEGRGTKLGKLNLEQWSIALAMEGADVFRNTSCACYPRHTHTELMNMQFMAICTCEENQQWKMSVTDTKRFCTAFCTPSSGFRSASQLVCRNTDRKGSTIIRSRTKMQ